MWCDCKIVKVIPPTQEEIDKDAEEQREEEAKNESPSKKKAKKTFFPPEHLFKYELQEVEPDDPEDNPVSASWKQAQLNTLECLIEVQVPNKRPGYYL